MKWKLSFFLILCLTFFKSQEKLSEVLSIKNIVYKIKDSTQQKLDIYLPQRSTEKFPVLIFVHGGGWKEGDKFLPENFYLSDFILRFVKNGYAVVSINYTLLDGNNHFPAPVEDCKEAIRWIRASSDFYNFDAENIGIWGASAGAQIALLSAYSDDLQFSGNSSLLNYSSKVSYVIDYFGPSDMNVLFRTDVAAYKIFIFMLLFPKIYDMRNDLILGFTGLNIKKQKEEAINLLRIYSPLTYINNNSVPTLIIHGTKDKVVPFSQSKTLKESLDKNDIKNEMILIKNGNHGLNKESAHEMMLERTLNFIKENTH